MRRAKRKKANTIKDHPIGLTSDDKIVGKTTLASLLDVTQTSVERWIREGMPFEQRGDHLNDWVFDLPAVMQWKKQNKD